MQTTSKKIGVALGTVAVAMILAATVAIVLALPVKWLWNWLCPEIFGLPTLNVLQAWGLSTLCSMLFKPGYKAKEQ
jgi:ABC-type transport system involved in multi-copper enzyme maturation permease subunit